ncbi:MAG: hypothetical protein HW421_2895 [Ignavibacteria bacterium]|nr:hypothetical protein [Ignavibacteria bacterium]
MDNKKLQPDVMPQQLQQSPPNILIIVGIGVTTAILWQVPFGSYLLYPFTILGTWFHEMSHGLAASALGGDFIKLELYPNGSGIAFFTDNLMFGGLGRAIVAGAGPMGPSIAGAIFILASRNMIYSRIIMFLLSIFMFLSAIIWIRSVFGVILIIVLGIILLWIVLKANLPTLRFTIEFLGVQAAASVFLSIDYLFSSGGFVDQRKYLSDTAVISDNLFLPYWFWGGFLLAFSIYLITHSLIIAHRKKIV